jgi:myo-inositol-1(or 4)-monophosphatase
MGDKSIDKQSTAMRQLLDIVRSAGQILEAGAQQRSTIRVEHKGAVDLVTDVDHSLQEHFLQRLDAEFPSDAVIAEESDAAPAIDLGGRVWYVDPLDGTTNFVHGFPFYAISIGLWEAGRATLACVYAPALDELFYAEQGSGAWLMRPERSGRPQRLQVSACASLQAALLATGFPYERGNAARLSVACVSRALASARGIRRAGSAALDLCYLAAGRLDGYFELRLSPWDVAAGSLIASEAGAIVTNFLGGAEYLHSRRICAASPSVQPSLLALLAEAHAAPESSPLGEAFAEAQPLEEIEDA